MKRILYTLLVLPVAFVYACQTPQNSNTNTNVNQANNSNANVTVSPNPDLEVRRSNHEKKVEVYIDDAPPGRCSIRVDPPYDSVTLAAGQEKVRWVVYNDCSAAEVDGTRITIDNFGKNNLNPFGTDPCDSKFIFDTIKKGEEGRLMSKTGKNQGQYKYTIRVISSSGTDLAAPLDPQVIVAVR